MDISTGSAQFDEVKVHSLRGRQSSLCLPRLPHMGGSPSLVYSVFWFTSLFKTLSNAAMIMSEKVSKFTGDRTSQKLRMAASNLSQFVLHPAGTAGIHEKERLPW